LTAGAIGVLNPFVYIPLQTPIPPNSPVERLVRMLDELCAVIAARRAGGVLTVPLFFLLWRRVRHTAVKAIKLAARIAAGVPPRIARPRTTPRPSRPPILRLPREFAWIVKPELAQFAADPRMRRLLNPLRRMLGVPARTMPPLRRPASAPKPPRPRRDSGKTPAGCHPQPPPAPVAA
jgi:hypothetical protein